MDEQEKPVENYFASPQFTEAVKQKQKHEHLRFVTQAQLDPNEAVANAVGTLFGIVSFFIAAGMKKQVILLLKDVLKDARGGTN